MAVRTVAVRLAAVVSPFTAGMRTASRSAARTAASIRTSMNNAATRTAGTMNRISTQGEKSLGAMRGASLGLLAVFAASVYSAAKFEHALSGVRAVTMASSEEMATLRDVALEAGRTTRYSATEAAQAMEELAKAGVSVADIAGGALRGALDLAAAAGVDVAEAAEIASVNMVVFGLRGRDMTHVADVFAAAANKSATDVHQMGLSFRMAAQVAAQTGLSLEDTAGSMALFASEGLRGSDAGTSFKVMLQRLTPQSNEARTRMEELGFSAYDASGRFIGLEGVAREMQEAFGQLSPEARNASMSLIFGSDAVRAATILYKNGADGVREWVAAVDDQGYAAAVAAARMDNLVGDLQYLRSAIETALIQSGTAANDVLRDMTQWITRVVNAYNSLPPGLQQTAVLLSGIVGVAGLVGASMLLMLPRIAAVRAELAALGITAATARGALMGLGRLGLVTAAVGAIAWGVSEMADQFDDAGPSVDELTTSLIRLGRSGRVTGEAARVFGDDLGEFGDAVARIAHPGNLDRVNDALYSITHFGFGNNPELEEAREMVEAFDASLANMVSSGAPGAAAQAFSAMADAAEESGVSTNKLRGMLPRYRDALAATTAQTELATESQGTLSEELGITNDQLEEARSQAEQLNDALEALNGTAISAAEAEISFQASLDSLTETLEDNGRTLNINKEAGRENLGAILDSITAAQEYAQAVAEQTGSLEEGQAAFEGQIGALRETLRAAGYTEDQIRELTNTYAQLPSEQTTEIDAAGAEHAIEQLERLRERLAGLPEGHTVEVDAPTDDVIQALERVGYTVERLPDRRVRITAPTEDAQGSVRDLRDLISGLRDRTVTIRHRTVYSEERTYWTDSSGGRHQTARAAGGPVFGPGTSTSDSIPAWLSTGEYVIRAAAVRRYGMGLMDRINGMRFARGGPVGFASGGRVTASERRRAQEEAREAAKRAAEERKRLIAEVRSSLGGLRGALGESADDIASAAETLREDLGKLGKEGKALARASKAATARLTELAKSRDALSGRIAEAKEYGQGVRGDVRGFLGLDTEARSMESLIAGQQRQVAAAQQFRRDIASFQRRGLRDDLLQQVIEEGPGGRLAQLLRGASDQQIKQLNALAKTGAGLARSIGMDAADAMFDAGAQAGKGFLAGLKAQEAALEKQMSRIAEAAVNTIKKKLKIRSPSAVMRDEVGAMVGAGLVAGMDRARSGVVDAAGRLSDASMVPLPGRQFAAAGLGRREVADLVRAVTNAAGNGGSPITINARTADFTLRDLERVQRVQDARARVGRPR